MLKTGWEGRFFEDFSVGDIYRHPYGRTVTETDNIWFTNLTLNTNQSHFNNDYAQKTLYGKALVNSCFTLALVTGMSVIDVSQNAVANLEWSSVKMPQPLFIGETVYAQTEVLEIRESKSRPYAGIITIKTVGYTANGTIVLELTRKVMVYRRDAAPQLRLPGPNPGA